jgi:hypothetical protein
MFIDANADFEHARATVNPFLFDLHITGATGVSPVQRGEHWRHASGTQSINRKQTLF